MPSGKRTLMNTAENRRRFCEELVKNQGNVTKAARAIGVAPRTVYGWRQKDKVFALDWQDASNEVIDNVEEKLALAAEGKIKLTPPQIKAATVFLNAKAQDRGYTYTQKHGHEHAGDINLTIKLPKEWEKNGGTSGKAE